jgi:hypothetical protein
VASIREFVARVTGQGSPDFVPPTERVAVFDNDGTLWCEKPMPIELGFILQRLAAMADQDPKLADRQPWKAAYDRDYDWPGEVITKHYAGHDSAMKVLLGGILQAFAGVSVEHYQAAPTSFWSRAGTRPWALPRHLHGWPSVRPEGGSDRSARRQHDSSPDQATSCSQARSGGVTTWEGSQPRRSRPPWCCPWLSARDPSGPLCMAR